MQCWKCGGQTVDGVCTLCGCRESDRKPAVTPAGKAMRYVYDKFGAKRALTESGVLVRCLGDVLPEEAELRRALTEAFSAGAGREFYALLESNQPLTDASFQGLVQVLRAAGLSEKDAHAALVALWDMVGCGTPAASQPAPQPAPQPVPNRPVERPKVQPEPVERPKYAQEQPRQTPAPKPMQANVNMGWHDLLCKVVWWLAAVAGLVLLVFIDQYPYVEGLQSAVEMRSIFAAVFLFWGFSMRKKLMNQTDGAYIHPPFFFGLLGIIEAITVVDLYNNEDFYPLVEYYQNGATGCEEFAGLAWAFWIYCAVTVVLFALVLYTWNYYKDPQRRALFDQK